MVAVRVDDHRRQKKATLTAWVPGALRSALFFQAHRDSSWRSPFSSSLGYVPDGDLPMGQFTLSRGILVSESRPRVWRDLA